MDGRMDRETCHLKYYFRLQWRSREFKNGVDKTKNQNFVQTYVKDSFEKNMFPCFLGLNCPKLCAVMSA